MEGGRGGGRRSGGRDGDWGLEGDGSNVKPLLTVPVLVRPYSFASVSQVGQVAMSDNGGGVGRWGWEGKGGRS